MKEEQPILVFDTNIFLTGIDFNLINAKIYTTHNIIKEIKVKKYREQNRNIMNKIQAAIYSKKLTVKSPLEKYVQEIERKSRKTGEVKALSSADKELIALTLELIEMTGDSVVLYTNDYSMENLCSEMNIPFSSLNKKGIKSKIIWEIFCPFCNEVFDVEYLNRKCEICGNRLRRRPKK